MKKLSLLLFAIIISSLAITQTRLSQFTNPIHQNSELKEEGDIQKKANYYTFCLQLNKLNNSKQFAHPATETKQRLDSMVSESWLLSSEAWIGFYKAGYVYDENGLTTEYDLFFMDEISEIWDTAQKIFYEYDDDQNMIKSHSIIWNTVDSLWEDNHYATYFYNEQNQLSSYIFTTWDDIAEKWVDVFQMEYLYNSDGLLDTVNQYSALYDSIDWELLDKAEYTYDVDKKLTQILASSLIEEQWQPYFQQFFYYETDENVSSALWQDWDPDKNDWVNTDKEEYDYDANGNNTAIYEFSWEEDENTWVQDYMSTNTFDLNYFDEDLILPQHSLFSFLTLDEIDHHVNMLTGTFLQLYYQNDWINWTRSTYHYSEQDVSAVPSINENNFAVYPNPADKYITIENKNVEVQAILEIFSLSGKQLLTQQINGNEKVDISHLNTGIYFYKIKSDKDDFTGKLMVK